MKQTIEKLKKSKLCQRILKLGLAYVALELVIALGVIFFVTQNAIT